MNEEVLYSYIISCSLNYLHDSNKPTSLLFLKKVRWIQIAICYSFNFDWLLIGYDARFSFVEWYDLK